jgi:SAM-dependent methyltransferase
MSHENLEAEVDQQERDLKLWYEPQPILQNAELRRLQSKVAQEEMAQLLHEIESLRSSMSWKITAPLRRAYDVVASLSERFQNAVLPEQERWLAVSQRLQRIQERMTRLAEGISKARREVNQRGLPLVNFGDLDSTLPISPMWGFERGQAIDRYYVENFLEANRRDIRGRVLEVRDNAYTTRFGSGVELREVIDIDEKNSAATVHDDLTKAQKLQSNHYDCVILTQTLAYIYDARAAIAQIHRVLKPGGVLLLTDSALNRMSPPELSTERDYWRFTRHSLTALLTEHFAAENVRLETNGNVKVCAAFLYGLAAEDLTPEVLAEKDARFPLQFCVRAVKQRV